MKQTILLFATCVALLAATVVRAQDIHFSQFYMSPLNLNPAMTGVMNCNVRLTANYRNQLSSVLRGGVYNTYSASYDQRFTSGRYDYWGLGATAWADVAGSADLGSTTFKVSGSYAKRLAGDRRRSHYLSAGIDAGIGRRSIDFLKLRWGNQFDGSGFDPGIPSGEEFDPADDDLLFANVAAGILWFSNFGDDANLYVGGAFHNLNRADVSFADDGEDLLYSRFTVHAGGEFPIARRVGLVPGIILMRQGPSMQVNSGASVKFLFGNARYNEQAFHVGAWTRIANNATGGVLNDAIILQTRFDYNEYSLGFSYDVNVSSLAPASNRQGAFELALQYKFCGGENRGVYCPNF